MMAEYERFQEPATEQNLEAENARLQARMEEAEAQLRDQVANDLGEFLEVVQRGVALWNYVDMMLLPKLEGLLELIPATHAVLREVETERDAYKALAEECREALEPFLASYDSAQEQLKEMEGRDIEECHAVLLSIPMEHIRDARAVLAPGCGTCGGSRTAPVSDEDLGGEGVTMSPCPDCGEEKDG